MDKPLNVQVAEALGYQCQPCDPTGQTCQGWRFSSGHCPPHVPDYSDDWSVIGPLIKKYGIRTTPIYDGSVWKADSGIDGGLSAEGCDPQTAASGLIVALNAAGELET